MTRRAERDPFGSTTDARAYVPRPACEAALAELQATLRGGRRVALTGPNGIGKTQLLRVLEARLGDGAEMLILPYAGVEFDDLCRWILGLWKGVRPVAGDDEETLVEDLQAAVRAKAEEGRMIVLALDDASGMPMPTARKLGALIDRAEGALRLLVVPVDDPRAGRLLAALGSDLETVRFSTPMTENETRHYIASRLDWAAPPAEIAARFDEGTVRWLHRASGGIPRELHRLALQVQRGIGREAAQAGAEVPWLDVEPEVLDATRGLPEEAIAPALVLDDEPVAPREPVAPAPTERADAEPSVDGSEPERAGAGRRAALVFAGALALLGAGWGLGAFDTERPRSERSPGVTESSFAEGAVRESPPSGQGVPLGPARPADGATSEALVAAAEASENPRASWPPPREPSDRDPFRVPPDAAPRDAEPVDEGAVVGAVQQVDPEAELIEVSVNAVPWAVVVIDGIERGTTPLAGIQLEEGVHRFRLLHADGRIREADRLVTPQQRAFAFGVRPAPSESTEDPDPATSPRVGP